MENRSRFGAWPPLPPPPHGQNAAGEFRPGMHYPQHSPRPNPPVFHQFPPRGSGAPPGPPGPPAHVAYRNVHFSNGGTPGFNNTLPGWSPYPRGYQATVPSSRMTSPNTIHSQSQSFAPGLGYGGQGNVVSVNPPSQGQSQQAQQGLYVPTYDGRGTSVVGHSVSAVVPWSNDVRPNSSVKPIFLSWIDEVVKDSSSSDLRGYSGPRGSSLKTLSDNLAVPKSSDLYRLVEHVEDTISKILALTNMQSVASRTEWGVCRSDPHHVVPLDALLRHRLQCSSSLAGSVDAGSFLNCLQYPHTLDLDPTKPFTRNVRMTDRHPGAESSSNDVTLSFEDVTLFNVNSAPTRRLELEFIKQDPDHVDAENSSEILRVKAKMGTDNWSEKPECSRLTLSTDRQQFDPRGSLFFYRDAPGVLTSFAHQSSNTVADIMSSLPHSLKLELEKCPYVAFKTAKNEETSSRSFPSSTRTMGNTVVEGWHADEEESRGAVKESISAKWIGMTDSEAGGSLSRIQQVGEREEAPFQNDTSCVRLLPSMLWNLERELESWQDMPSQCSRTVLEAATGLGRVRKASIAKWLLMHSPAYEVDLDVALAAHISCLVQLYLKALRTQSLFLFDQSFVGSLKKGDTAIPGDTKVVECPIYAEASTWLASWLSHLYGPINSKVVVLGILKHCLQSSGRFLSVVSLDPHLQQIGFKTTGNNEDVKDVLDEEIKVFMGHSQMPPNSAGNTCVHVPNPVALEDVLEVKQVGAAMDALYERANFERHIKSWMSMKNFTKLQRIANYDMIVSSANNERAKRPTYRAVCEHDGLTWQRSHQEEKRNKTKAELLAEERDYKRRRMSYRGKKLKRTPLQVLHDIIENHMSEIAEAGGIGCFSKQPLPMPPQAHTDLESQQQMQSSISSKSHFQHQSGSAHYSGMTNSETAGNMLRPYDGRGETSSAVRNEPRPRSHGRYDDERHHHTRR